jgi:predicted Holliday junction resolvase-like endonuclease
LPTDISGLLIGIAFGFLLAYLYFLVWRLRYTASIRRDAVQRSEAVTAGKVHEQLVAYLPAFPYNPKDVRFLGTPVDLVIFDGLTAGHLDRIVFLEIKTGGAGLTARERSIREVVRAGAVDWQELRVGRSLASTG